MPEHMPEPTMPHCAHCPYPLAASEVYAGHTVCDVCRAMARSLAAAMDATSSGIRVQDDPSVVPDMP